MAKKPPTPPYPPPTPKEEAIVAKLAERTLVPFDGVKHAEPQLIPEADKEWKPLYKHRLGLTPGVQVNEMEVGGVISLLSPAQVNHYFGSHSGALEAGFTLSRGGMILNAMQVEAIRFGNAEMAELLVAAMPRMKIFFQYSDWCVGLVPAARLDELLMGFTQEWNAERDMLTWFILEGHKSWSPELSRRILDGIVNAGPTPRHRFFTWGGPGLALNIHPSVIDEAIVTLKPWAAGENGQPNAKRWTKKLKERKKALAG